MKDKLIKVHSFINKKFNQYMDARTEEFKILYEDSHRQPPSEVRIKTFRKEYILKQSVTTFLLISFLTFVFTTTY